MGKNTNIQLRKSQDKYQNAMGAWELRFMKVEKAIEDARKHISILEQDMGQHVCHIPNGRIVSVIFLLYVDRVVPSSLGQPCFTGCTFLVGCSPAIGYI